MSDDSESVTMLADIPANCGMYTAQEVRDYVSGAISDYDSGFASGCGAVVAIGSLEWNLENVVYPVIFHELPATIDNRILPVSGISGKTGNAVLTLASGVSGLKNIYFNKNIGTNSQEWDRVMLESEFESEQLVCGMTNVQFMQAIAKGVWNGIGSGLHIYDPDDAVAGAFDGYECGHVVYQRLDSLGGSPGSIDSVMNLLADLLDTFNRAGDSGITKFSGFLNDIIVPYSGGNFCDMVNDCVSGQFVETCGLCEALSGAGCLSGYNANLQQLINTIQDLYSGVSGLNLKISGMITSLSETIVETLTNAATSSPDEQVRAKAAAAKDNFENNDDVKAATILNAKKDVAGSITNDIIGGLTEVADELDAPNTNDDVAGAASEVDGGGETAVEAQDTSDDITKPGGVNDGLEQLAASLLGGGI